MGSRGIVALAAFAATGAVAVAAMLRSAPSAPSADLAVVITADLRGYLEPCGCSEHMLGGLDRVAAQVGVAKEALGAAVHVGGGDSLFEGPPIDAAHGQQDALKARTLLQAFAQMHTVALALGPRDLPMGKDAVAQVKPAFPVLGGGVGPGYEVSKAAGISLGVATGADAKALIANVKAAKAHGAEAVIALAEFPLPKLLPAGPGLKAAGATVAVVAHQDLDTEGESNHVVDADLPVLTLMSRGRSVARLALHRVAGAPTGFTAVTSNEEQAHDLKLRDDEIESLKKRAHLAHGPLKQAMEKKIAEKVAQRDALAARKPAPPAGRSWFSLQFVQLSDEKPKAAPVKALIDHYDTDLGQLNLAWAEAHGESCPVAKPGQPAFVGTDTCIACHANPGAVWHGTAHSHAYATLEKVHKQYDLDCIRCHVVGVDAPGGVCRVDQTKGRQDVGCESCHGAGSLHAQNPNVAPPVPTPQAQNCRVCHTALNSTAFDFATYLPQILGPGHGEPMVTK